MNGHDFLDTPDSDFLEEHHYYAEIEEQEQFEHDVFLQPIDINHLKPSGEVIEMQFGNAKPEKLSTTSKDIAQKIIEHITEGFMDPLDFAVKKKLIVDAFEIVFKDSMVKSMMIEEIEKRGKEGATALGAKLSLTSRAAYEYAKDSNWAQIKEQMAPLEAKLKAQEEKIKMACKGNANLVNHDGEIIASVVPAPSTTSVAVSFLKGKK